MAAAISEYINAYFKGGQHNRSASGPSCRSTSQRHVPTFKSFVVIPFVRPSSSRCLVKITGDLTMSFPAGITRILAAPPSVPVLSFRLLSISRIDHFLPNQKLLYRSADVRPLIMGCVSSVLASPPCLSVRPSSDPSQSDPDTRDFWFNMQALQLHLQREAELNPQASYYNVGIIKYQVRLTGRSSFIIRALGWVVERALRLLSCHLRTRPGLHSCSQPSVSAAARSHACRWTTTAAPPRRPPPS